MCRNLRKSNIKQKDNTLRNIIKQQKLCVVLFNEKTNKWDRIKVQKQIQMEMRIQYSVSQTDVIKKNF